MIGPEPQKLSELLGAQEQILKATTRRRFIANASALSLAIPGVGAALASCSPGDAGKGDTAIAAGPPAQQSGGNRVHNSDSKLDSVLLKGAHGHTSVTVATPATETPFRRYSPELP